VSNNPAIRAYEYRIMDKEDAFTTPSTVSPVATLELLRKPNIAVRITDIIEYKDSIIANAYV
jgi:hypothetical protein